MNTYLILAMTNGQKIALVVAIIVFLALFIFCLNFLNLFIQSWSSGAYISPMNLILMKLILLVTKKNSIERPIFKK